ncbi:MAG: hypothetical protein Q4C98_08620 [Capnocytophaga sp.]|nr:hypothetical protein [Capnocytophaga sp.]
MKTLNISISELEYAKFGIKDTNLSFSELIDIVYREILKSDLKKTIELAEKYRLSTISMEDINNEVKAVRKNAEINTISQS